MIITKTPYRISFFGGGSDYPSWYEKNGGAVLSTTIDKFLYISCRFSPKYFKKKYRIVWRKIENVQRVNQINHKVVRELLKYLKIKPGLEIHYYGDLPARSGMGSSSCFTVGLMQSLYRIKKINLNKLDLAKKSIYFEQNVMKEVVGSQDQISASYGGFNKITFSKNNTIKVKKILSKENLKKLNKNLVLIYTGINRTAHKIASSYVKKLTTNKKNYIKNILEHVHEGEKILMSGNVDDFGKLLNSSWTLKKKLSASISNRQIDDLYNQAIYNGALGGKLLGAGGGGFLLMYMKKKYRENFFKKYPKIINTPFKFSNVGTEVIFKDLNR
jgi:D-glycero-alpha-D-manno-heptose-7-phosphate kinase|tara:strand:- start:562 stop:1548 length:987 start_codon:yes stop_codon:yes gene_type:complete